MTKKRKADKDLSPSRSSEQSEAGTPLYDGEAASPGAGASITGSPSSQSVQRAQGLNQDQLNDCFVACINVLGDDDDVAAGALTLGLQKGELAASLAEHVAENSQDKGGQGQKKLVGDQCAGSVFCFVLNFLFDGLRSTQDRPQLLGNQKNEGNELTRLAKGTLDEGLYSVYLDLHKYGLTQHGPRLFNEDDGGEMQTAWKTLQLRMIQKLPVKIKEVVRVFSTVAPGILHFVCEAVNHMALVAAEHEFESSGSAESYDFPFPLVSTFTVSKTLNSMLSGTGLWCCHLTNRVDVYIMSLVALIESADEKRKTWTTAFTEEAIYATVLHQLFQLHETLDSKGSKYARTTAKAFLADNVNRDGHGAEALNTVHGSFGFMVWYMWHNLINKKAHTELLDAYLARRESDQAGAATDKVAIVLHVVAPDESSYVMVFVDYDKLAFITDDDGKIQGAKGFMAALEEQFEEGGDVRAKLSEDHAEDSALKVVLQDGFEVSNCAVSVVDFVAQYEFAAGASFLGFASRSAEKPPLENLDVSVLHRDRPWILPSSETIQVDGISASAATFIGDGPCMVPTDIRKKCETLGARYTTDFDGTRAATALTNAFNGLDLDEEIMVHGGVIVTIAPQAPAKFAFALKVAVTSDLARTVADQANEERRLRYQSYCTEVQFHEHDLTLTPMESVDGSGCIQEIGNVYNVFVGSNAKAKVDTTGARLGIRLRKLVNDSMRLCMLVRSRPIASEHNSEYADPDGELQLAEADNTFKAVDLRFLWRYCKTSPVSSLSSDDIYKRGAGRMADINNAGALRWFCGEMCGEMGPSFVDRLQEKFGVDPDFKLEDLDVDEFPERVDGHSGVLNEGGSVKFTRESVTEIKRVFAEHLTGTLAGGAVHLVVLPEWYPYKWKVNG